MRRWTHPRWHPRVIELAAAFARANGGELGLVHAVDPVTRYHVQHVVIGDAAREIGALADREGYDLIVMGSRGAGGIGRTLLGSVAASVMRTCERPVAVVTRADDPDASLPAA